MSRMLAYTFWHWRQASVPIDDYLARQQAFHAALAAEPPVGFQRSMSHQIRGAEWANDGGEAFEDWYLVRTAADLDPLNSGAITASRKAAHDAAAAMAAGGAAGLYLLQLGTPPEKPRHATWFGKPPTMSYPDLLARLEPVVASGEGALWMRFMVLGPTPEFCLQTVRQVAISEGFTGRSIELESV